MINTYADNPRKMIQVYIQMLFIPFTQVQACPADQVPEGRGNPCSHIGFKQQVSLLMPGLMFSLDGESIWNSLLPSHPRKEQTEEEPGRNHDRKLQFWPVSNL